MSSFNVDLQEDDSLIHEPKGGVPQDRQETSESDPQSEGAKLKVVWMTGESEIYDITDYQIPESGGIAATLQGGGQIVLSDQIQWGVIDRRI